MVAVTLFVAAVCGILAFISSPGRALGILIVSMMVWPEYLRIPMGPAEMSAPRLVALLMLARFIMLGRNRRMNFCSVDWLVLLLWIWTMFASIVAGSESAQITRMIGQGFDTVLMYFVARLAILSRADLKTLALPLFAVAVFMCVTGWSEAITAYSPYQALDKYKGWVWIPKDVEFRLGLKRAKASMSVHIYFGMAMAVIAGMAWSLRADPRIKKIATLGAFFAALGAFSSMSSGPWLAVAFLILCNAYILRPSLIKPTLYFMVVAAIFIEIASNRHFYNLIDYLALNSSTAWYRTKLLEVAFSQWRDYWLVGVGSKSIQYWGSLLDGRNHVDLVNQFLVVAVNGGIPASLMYIFSHVNAVRFGIKVRKKSQDPIQRKLIFFLVSSLIALDISSMSVGLFGPPLLLGNILLGVLTSAAVSWREATNRRPRKLENPPIASQTAVRINNSSNVGIGKNV